MSHKNEHLPQYNAFPDCAGPALVALGFGLEVVVEKGQALVAADLLHIAGELVAATEDAVELVVAESYAAVIFDGAAVVDFADIRPHAGTKAHVAGFTCGVDGAAAQVKGSQACSGITYRRHLAVACGIIVFQNAVVAASHYYAVFDYHGTERTAVMGVNTAHGLLDGHLHILNMFCHDYCFLKIPNMALPLPDMAAYTAPSS